MLKTVFRKTLYEKRWMLLAWSVGILAMTIFTMVFYPYFKQSGFEDVVKSLPESLKSFVGSVEAYKTIGGYVAQQIYGPQIPIITIILAVILAINLSASDEDQGTMQTLLTQPVSRQRVFFDKLLALATILGIVSFMMMLGVMVSLPFVHEHFSTWRLLQATFGAWLLNLAFGMVAYAAAMATGKKGFSIGLASGYAFFSFMMASLAPAVQKLQSTQKASMFYYYNSPTITEHGINWLHITVLVGFIAVLAVASLLRFVQRDLS